MINMRIFLVGMVLLLLTSCSKERMLVKAESALHIYPQTGSGTKGMIDGSNLSSASIGIQVTNSAGDALYRGNSQYSNLRLYNPGAGWITDDGSGVAKDVILVGDNAKIFAYYPYDNSSALVSGVGAGCSLLLDIPRVSDASTIKDYLWAAQSTTLSQGGVPINAANNSVQLNMNHAMATVAFVFYKTGYSGPGVINSMTIKSKSSSAIFRANKSTGNDLQLSLANGSVTGGTMGDSLRVQNIGSTITLTAKPDGTDPDLLYSQKSCYMFVSPTTVSSKSDLEFLFDIDGRIFTATIDDPNQFLLEAGNFYIFSAGISSASITITDVDVWNDVVLDSDSGYDSDNTWFGLEPVTIGTTTWAPVNVGYDPLNPMEQTYFQWHRKYGQKIASMNKVNASGGALTLVQGSDVLNMNNFFYTTYNPYIWYSSTTPAEWDMSSAYNPCPIGWRVPTYSQINDLKNSGSVYVSSEPLFGGLAGRWYGGNYQTDRNGSVFLPISCVLNYSSGDVWGVGEVSYYLSTTSSSNIYLLSVQPTQTTIGLKYPSFGCSLRCVKE